MKLFKGYYKEQASFFRTIACENCILILKALISRDFEHKELMSALNFSDNMVYKATRKLKECNLIHIKKLGKTKAYTLTSPMIKEVLINAEVLADEIYSEV